MGNGEYDIYLRPEARPVPYEKLQRRLKEVLGRIVRTLDAARQMAKDGIVDENGVVKNRVNRIFFVSGEPGSGKTTLYLTLRAMLGKNYSKYFSEKMKKEEEKIFDRLKGLRGTIRWLQAIDLEVVRGNEDNLLAAVLVRLFKVLDQSETRLSGSCEKAIKELEELAADIGIAWDGNLQARASALDPDNYSEEVMRAQRARFGIDQRLGEALDELAENNCCECTKNTLFVLPVDDFYLKPEASLQLLRLLRMISIPRLFFLVMGDIKTVEALFTEKALADWTKVAGVELFLAKEDRLEDALTQAREMRARYLRKLLPLGQRATIEPMDWFEALEFEFKGEKLKTLLRNMNLDSSQGPNSQNFLDFLVSPKINFPDVESHENPNDASNETLNQPRQERKAREGYTALQILDATPREILDFATLLHLVKTKRESPLETPGNEPTDSGSQPELLFQVGELVNQIRDEQSFFSEKQQRLLDGIFPTRHYAPEEIIFGMEQLRLEPDCYPWEEIGKLCYRKHRAWDLKPEHSEKKELNGPFAKLPPRPAAWIILLHDLALYWKSESVNGNLVKKIPGQISKTLVPPKITSTQRKMVGNSPTVDGSRAGWLIRKIGKNYVHYPLPDFQTVKDLDYFLRVWSAGLEWLKSNSQGTKLKKDDILNLWYLSGRMVLDDRYEEFAKRNPEWFRFQLDKIKEGDETDPWATKCKKFCQILLTKPKKTKT